MGWTTNDFMYYVMDNRIWYYPGEVSAETGKGLSSEEKINNKKRKTIQEDLYG